MEGMAVGAKETTDGSRDAPYCSSLTSIPPAFLLVQHEGQSMMQRRDRRQRACLHVQGPRGGEQRASLASGPKDSATSTTNCDSVAAFDKKLKYMTQVSLKVLHCSELPLHAAVWAVRPAAPLLEAGARLRLRQWDHAAHSPGQVVAQRLSGWRQASQSERRHP